MSLQKQIFEKVYKGANPSGDNLLNLGKHVPDEEEGEESMEFSDKEQVSPSQLLWTIKFLESRSRPQ